MLIAQLSDPHVTRDLSDLPVDPCARLDHVIDAINSRAISPDLAIVTGDLINNGTADEYQLLRTFLDRIDTRVLVIPGNHDNASLLRSALSDFLPDDCAANHVSYVIDDYPLRLVCLDTSWPGRADGVFDTDRAAWLDDALAASNKPTMVFMHHPAFDSGIAFMDTMRLDNPEEFAAIIAKHQHVSTVASGHLHRSLTTRIAHATAVGAPSTTHQLALNFDPTMAGLSLEPSGYLLHAFDGQAVLTHSVTVGEFEVVPLAEFSTGMDPN